MPRKSVKQPAQLVQVTPLTTPLDESPEVILLYIKQLVATTPHVEHDVEPAMYDAYDAYKLWLRKAYPKVAPLSFREYARMRFIQWRIAKGLVTEFVDMAQAEGIASLNNLGDQMLVEPPV